MERVGILYTDDGGNQCVANWLDGMEPPDDLPAHVLIEFQGNSVPAGLWRQLWVPSRCVTIVREGFLFPLETTTAEERDRIVSEARKEPST